jgi:hypothetical protein
MSVAGMLRRWVLLGAVTGVLALFLVPRVGARSSPADSPADGGSNQPVPRASIAGPLNFPATADTSEPELVPASPPAGPAGHAPARSTLDVILESLFDDVYSPEAQARWTPLPLRTSFTEGWDQPYVVPTSGSGGAPLIILGDQSAGILISPLSMFISIRRHGSEPSS